MKTLIFVGILSILFVTHAKAEEDLYERITILTPISEATQVIENESTNDFLEIIAGENPGEEFLKKQLPLKDQ
jgi:hypothetical protein